MVKPSLKHQTMGDHKVAGFSALYTLLSENVIYDLRDVNLNSPTLRRPLKRLLISTFIIIAGLSNLTAQMNFQDSTVQVISYWDMGEKYEYSVVHQRLKYNDQDTSSNETITYEVEVSVIDSTATSYTARWFYKNFTTDSNDPIVQKIAAVSEDIAVEIQLDEFGSIVGVVNWEEIRDYMYSSFDLLIDELPKASGLTNMITKMKLMYATKESIEATAIQDAQQYHNFHGGKFRLNEKVTGQLKTPNLYYPDRPFDTDVSVILEELDQEYNEYKIRSINEVNSEQLTATTYEYLGDLLDDMNQDMPAREEFQDLSNTVEIVSRIHNTGWVLESVSWKEVVAEGRTNMDIRTITMK